ncbi:MAG: aminotransferase class III-fold pyridoxal phosphate-dependent enzyme, partial [Myxococcales bacterium]|nr:aminotransferase class III-fold pyridoxal phosphate-dependent enzyme [Myxococcales bacterium]
LPGAGGGRGAPMAPGIPASSIADTLVLRYDDPAALDYIRAHGHELAAVLVEPVQSRRPDQQPRAFLHELRVITRELGVALIFDEVVTGFRIGPGGAQEHFDVDADIATYGKVVGGGMPVGIVAGRERFMAGIDGGLWRFGDGSRPSGTNTFVAGTFCSHPLAMATTLAVLQRIAGEGEALYRELDRKTATLCGALDRVFAEREVDIRMVRFGSLFRFVVRGDQELLYYKLLSKGVYVWEGRNCFLSTAHDDEDLARVIEAVTASADELFTRPKPQPKRPPSELIPATVEQARMFARCELPGGNRSYNTIAGYTVHGPLDTDRLAAALQGLVDRHESLRTGFERDGDGAVVQRIHARAQPRLIVRELDEAELAAFEDELLAAMALTGPSLVCAGVARLGPQRQLLLLVVHHLVTDGLSSDLIIDELVKLYDGEDLAPGVRQFREFVAWERAYLDSARAQRDRAFWLAQLDGVEALELPSDGPRGPRSFATRSLFVTLEPALVAGLQRLAQARGATLNMVMLSVYAILLAQLSGGRSFCVGGPCAGRPDGLFDEAIGMFMGAIGYRVSPTPDKTFTGFLEEVRRFCVDAYDAQHYPFPLLAEGSSLEDRAPRSLYQVGFSFETYKPELPQAREWTLGRYPVDKRMLAVDLILRCQSQPGPLTLHFAANAALFAEPTLQRWTDAYLRLCAQVLADPSSSLARLLEASLPAAPGLVALG